eukprot:TRINITY_DN16756_c0_g1_i1.p1 TRINITY_DN16756_c0_g1~~TRINITY_DN16756_c0_g1_i1.p1  ORF type:complete len:608 (-),score=169.40 TRINITY_DN16756_c0_g1_i1:32-1813(-)
MNEVEIKLRKEYGLLEDDDKDEIKTNGTIENDEENMEDSEEDEIVEEIDVYFSNTMNDHLHIFQYPLRPNWRPYERKESDQVTQKEPPLGFSVKFNLDKNNSDSYSQFANHMLDSFTITSNKVPINSHYALAKIHNSQLHLSSINSIQQFRPNFSYIDEKDKKNKKEIVDEDYTEGKEKKPKKTEKKLREEPTEQKVTTLNKFEISRKETIQMFKKVICETNRNIDWELSPEQYLSALITPSTSDGSLETLKEDISMFKLQNMNVAQRIHSILNTIDVIPLKRLFELLNVESNIKSSNYKPEEAKKLIEMLNDQILLVRGRVVIHSSKKYKEQSDVLAHLYTLSLFHHSGSVNQKQLMLDLQYTHEKTQALLRTLGLIHKESRIWYLKCPVDELVPYYAPDWEDKFNSFFNKNSPDSVLKIYQKSMNKLSNNNRKKGGVKPSTVNMENILLIEKKEEILLKNFIFTLFLQEGILDESSIVLSFPNESKTEWKRLLPSFLSRYTITLGSLFALKNFPVDNKYEKSLKDEFHAYRSVLLKFLEKKTANELFGYKEQDLVIAIQESNLEYNQQLVKIVMEEFCFKQGNQWLLKSGN